MRILPYFLFVFLSQSLYAETIRVVLEPQDHTILSAEVPSTVTKINRRMGEPFKKEDVLMELDSRIFLATKHKAEAQVAKAEADFSAQEKLFRDRAVTAVEYRASKSNLEAAKADLVIANKALSDCTIVAPYDGKVVMTYVKEFERVEAGHNLVEIINDEVMVAKLLLPAALLPNVKLGDSLKVVIPDMRSPFVAKVVRISSVIDPASGLVKVDAEIDNKKGLLRAGLEGEAEIGSPQVEREKNPQGKK